MQLHRCRDHVRRLARLLGRVIQIALGTVTNDVLMKYSQSLRANGSDQGERGPREGREPSRNKLRGDRRLQHKIV